MRKFFIQALSLSFFLMIVPLMSGSVWAQTKTLAQWQSVLTSSWMLTVQGEPATRLLKVSGVAQKTDGSLMLETTYGMTGGKLGPMRAEITSDQKMVFTTGADAKVVATEAANGDFVGTITYKNGLIKNVTLSRISEAPLLTTAQTAGKTEAAATGAAAAMAGSGTNTSGAEGAKPKATLFYFGTDSCPTCRGWKSFDLPKLKETEAFKSVRYVEVQKAIPAPIPSADNFPPDLAPLRDVISNRFKGKISSPMFAMVVGDEVKWAYMGAPDNKQVVDAILAATK